MSVDFGYFRRGRRSFLRTTCQRSSYKAFPITSIVCICHFVAVRSPIALSLGLELSALRGTGGHVTQHPRVSSALVGGVFNSFRCCSLHVRPACGKNRDLGRRVHAAHLLRSIPGRDLSTFSPLPCSLQGRRGDVSRETAQLRSQLRFPCCRRSRPKLRFLIVGFIIAASLCFT